MVEINEPRMQDGIAFSQESAKLADVVQHIQETRTKLEGQMPATADHQQTADAIQKILQDNSDSFFTAIEQPYFGRLDYFRRDSDKGAPDLNASESDDPPKTPNIIYLGIVHIPGKDVFSWTAPIGQLWYTQSYENGYTAPRGYIPTRVDLKRYLRIRDEELESVNDIFRRALPAPESGRQDVLTEALSGTGSGDGHLQVIVETIEPEQYENIANVSDKALIVQGAAGSGKSEIGLHRIAFLLSPHNDIPERERPTPSTTLFVGPSQAFLEYAADILPSLGVQEKVEQVKFSAWAVSHLSERVRADPRILKDLLRFGEMKRFNMGAEIFKGSLSMGNLIERHLSEMARSLKRACLKLPEIPGPDGSVRVSRERVRVAVDETFDVGANSRRLNRMRERFIARITEIVLAEGRSNRNVGETELTRRRILVRDTVVTPWCDAAWPHVDFRDEYVSLLMDSSTVTRMAKDQLSDEEAQALADSARGMDNFGFADSDLGALAYLDHLLNDTIPNAYRHIVVDEAQDISPIEFKLLETSSSNNWFTILGDTAQRLTPYRGIQSWKMDLARVFGRADIEVQHARTSYRSNVHITRFNNRILRTFDKNIAAPIAFERDGHRVEYSRYRTADAMYQGVSDDIDRVRSMDGLEKAMVAILARDQINIRRFSEFRERLGLDKVPLVTDEKRHAAQTVLGHIPDMKGLEYDAVLVIGVNESFSDTVFNKKLLYLATTRAKHCLGIHWSGRQSPILRSISDRGIVWHRR